MRIANRYALSISTAAVVLAGCGRLQPPIGAPGFIPQSRALAARGDRANYKVVYSFRGGRDGANPGAGLIDVGGMLYGTTIAGGPYSCTVSGYKGAEFKGCGTVFSVTLGGRENVLHRFGEGPDGRNPFAGLVEVDGKLYGTTSAGGSHACYHRKHYYYANCGTVFSITPGGSEKVLHSFGGTDGAYPYAGLINVSGTLYGTTSAGGHFTPCYPYYYYLPGCGTVFNITTSGKEKVLHSFGGHYYGPLPYASLIDVGGKLYGTAYDGGARNGGFVFRITTNGAWRAIYSFPGDNTDGLFPYAGLIEANGMLYGTTSAGGGYSCISQGCGTVFSVTPDGDEKVLHSFGKGGHGGFDPVASLIELNGKFYGTTFYGGAGHSCPPSGSLSPCGTVFSITPSGTEKVLHSFDGTDGAHPIAGLINVNGTLYGTTVSGGAHGYGTIFSLKP